MGIVTKLLMVLFLTAAIVGCADPQKPEAQEPPQPPPSAADLLSKVERENAAGQPQVALEQARKLVASHSGTPEADAAAKLIPTLEAAVEAAAEAERVRAEEAAAEAESLRLAEKWSYGSSEDPMTSKVTKSASIESENTVDFDFPYSGPQHGTLTLRDHPSYGRDVILSIEKGQFLCPSYTDCQIRVRFDEANPERWSAIGPSDNSTTHLFLRSSSRFLQRLRKAKVVRIQASVYQEGEPMFEFQVGGFNHDRYSGNK